MFRFIIACLAVLTVNAAGEGESCDPANPNCTGRLQCDSVSLVCKPDLVCLDSDDQSSVFCTEHTVWAAAESSDQLLLQAGFTPSEIASMQIQEALQEENSSDTESEEDETNSTSISNPEQVPNSLKTDSQPPSSNTNINNISTSNDDGNDKTKLIIIICSAIGGALLLVLLIVICCCCCKKSNKRKERKALAEHQKNSYGSETSDGSYSGGLDVEIDVSGYTAAKSV